MIHGGGRGKLRPYEALRDLRGRPLGPMREQWLVASDPSKLPLQLGAGLNEWRGRDAVPPLRICSG